MRGGRRGPPVPPEIENQLVLALEGYLAEKSARLIAIDLLGEPWIAQAWHNGAAERGTARRRKEKARELAGGAYLDLVTGRAKPWRTSRASSRRAKAAAKARAATPPPLDPDWFPDPRDGPLEAAAPEDARYVDTGAAARYVGLSDSTMRRMRREHRGPPYVRKGRRVLYDLHALDVWMEGAG
ncbi:MAG: helix-turn-helix domain-containing protein [Rhodospirillales bacterium]|nr:helix-turn-helix domain-containing protein [Rhodospirillales bacterium]MDE0379697.1 helix-turn-helix domain-containing protein [Rhodospirillales bacterium]